MTTTITGAAPHVPDLFEVYDTDRDGRNSFDETFDGDLSVQLRTAGPRSGTYSALFASHAAAVALEDELATAATFTLTDTDRPLLDMTFALAGRLSVRLDRRTYNHWRVVWDFKEIP